MLTGRYDALTGAKRYEVYIILLMFIGGIAGAFYLGARVTTDNTVIAVKQIYDQGFTAGETTGIQQANAQRDQLVRSIAANCKEWETPGLNFGINLTGSMV
jgi:Trk-type K+ transport system membrane component